MRASSIGASLLLFVAACSGDSPSDPSPDTADAADEVADVADDVEVTPDATEPRNVWFIDDEEHPGLHPSLNCQLNGGNLYLNAADTGTQGTIQILIAGVPDANGTYTIVPDFASVTEGTATLTIGRDRDSANQFTAQSGTLTVTVATAAPREIRVTFTDLPATTTGGATAVLSGDVAAREGTFVGACDFDSLN